MLCGYRTPTQAEIPGPLLQNKSLYYTDKGESCFDEVHVWTGSAREDVALEPFKRWAEDELHMDPETNPAVHDWDPELMRSIIDRQRKKVRKARKEGKRVPQMCMVCDDLADQKSAMGSGLLKELMMRGRHSWISTILSTQKLRCIDHACRLQATCLATFKVRCLKDWLVVLEEFTAAVDPKVLQKCMI